MPSKKAAIGTALGTALALFFNSLPGFIEIETLLKRRENNRQISLVNEANAAEKRLEDTINFEVSGKIYSVQEDNAGKYSVFDAFGNFVKDEDIAQKAIFSSLVYEKYITKESLDAELLYKIAFKSGELMQYAKNTLGLIFFENYNIVSAAVEGGKAGGPKGALFAGLRELSKEAIIEIGKQVVGHPESISRDIAIEAYKVGYNNWKENVSIARNVRKSGALKYEDADRFLYQWFHASLLMAAANRLTDDIGNLKYDTSIDATVANTILALLGRNAGSLGKEHIISEVSKVLNESIWQYPPLKGFIENSRKIIEAYIKKKVELDERALSLIGEKALIQTGQGRYGNGLIAFDMHDITTIDIDTHNLITLTKGYFDEEASWFPNGRGIIFISNNRDDGWNIPREIYVMSNAVDPANLSIRRLTNNKRWEGDPKVSPNLEYAVYSSSSVLIKGRRYFNIRLDGKIYSLKLDGSGVEKRLTKSNCEQELFPSFSNDNKLAYLCVRGNLKEIVIMDFETRTEQSRIRIPYFGFAVISPNGNEILVLDTENNQYFIDLKTRSREDIKWLPKDVRFSRASWNSHGTEIVLGSQLYLANRDGNNLRLLYKGNVNNVSWQPIPLNK